MDDVQLDGAQDLDEEIPDADDEFALGGRDSEEEEEGGGGGGGRKRMSAQQRRRYGKSAAMISWLRECA